MARYEGRIAETGAQPLGADEAAELWARLSPSRPAPLDNPTVCYLSSSDGWHEAVKQLGGAFARNEARLMLSKEE